MIRLVLYVIAALAILALFLVVPVVLAAGTNLVIVEIYHAMKWIP